MSINKAGLQNPYAQTRGMVPDGLKSPSKAQVKRQPSRDGQTIFVFSSLFSLPVIISLALHFLMSVIPQLPKHAHYPACP